jgi:hypothetical protein
LKSDFLNSISVMEEHFKMLVCCYCGLWGAQVS